MIKSFVIYVAALFVMADASGMWLSSSVDGMRANLARDGSKSTCTKTAKHTYSWWYVDLGTPRTVSKIRINAIDLKNAFFTVTDEVPTFKLENVRSLSKGLCNIVRNRVADNTDYVVTCVRQTKGRYVVVEMLPPGDGSLNLMQLCEVDIL